LVSGDKKYVPNLSGGGGGKSRMEKCDKDKMEENINMNFREINCDE
jgi:hypothetical protein